MRTSEWGFGRPDVPGTPCSATLLTAIGKASVRPYMVTIRQSYRFSMSRYIAAEIGAAEIKRSGNWVSRGSGG